MRHFIFIGLLLLTNIVVGQSKKVAKEQAKAYIAASHYEDALSVLNSNKQLRTKDEEGRFLLAICHYQVNDLNAAKALLDELIATEKSPYPECWFYLGKIYHAQEQFSKAIEQYKTYLRLLRPDHPNRAMLIEEIKRCDNGIRLRFRAATAVVENMGDLVNSKHDEFAPILSPKRSSKLYFSAIRPSNIGGLRDEQSKPDETFGLARSDMYSSLLSGGQWQSAQPMHYLLNSPQHEHLLGFSAQGKVLLYYKGWDWERGTIFADTFQQNTDRKLKTTPFTGPNVGADALQNMFLYNDTLLIFSARRADAYGGLDLYKSVFKQGQWSSPENLGPQINSAFDETTPFLSRDGSTLYFSSNDSRKSVGGLDVFRSVYLKEAGRWSSAENMGFPINSAADDAHFILANDGFTAFFSSARKDGLGRRDLYIAYFSKYRQEMEPAVVQRPAPRPVTNTTTSAPRPIKPTPIVGTKPKTSETWSDSASKMSAISLDCLDALVAHAQQAPKDHLVLSIYMPIHTASQKTSILYEGMAYLKQVANNLAARGIAKERIFLRSLETTFHNQYELVASIAPETYNAQKTEHIIGSSIQDALNPALNKALVYKVQVLSVQKMYSNAKMSVSPALMLENTANLAHLRYTAGVANTYEAAKSLRKDLLAQGYKGAYIVPYLFGERIDKNRARAFVDKYPDLSQYLGR